MPVDATVQPLRISKTTPSSSPNKMAAANRPLSEISAGSMRRNSPSYNQATRKMIVSRETSPYTENSFTKSSPRDFWSTRETMSPTRLDVENSFTESIRSPSPSADASPKRRPSVEKLQQASRVKNSKIFELETKGAYDPTSLPIVERPSANRPLSQGFVNNSFTRFDSMRKENNPLRDSPQRSGHKRSETVTSIPTLTPTKLASPDFLASSPEKYSSPQGSPTKSSLSRTSQFGIHSSPHEHSLTWSDDDRCPTPRPTLHRHNKSVTFETHPPVVNEYENPTPEPSVSAASNGSREGSWESDDYYDEDSFDRTQSTDHDDSFDDDLENADKTPVVLPEHWSRMSPDDARKDLVDDDDDVFESSVIHTTQRDVLGRSASVNSDGESRPLPPLPSVQAHMLRKKDSRRNLAEHAEPEELVITNLDTGVSKSVQVLVAEQEVQEDSIISELEELTKAPPRISRESILAKVRGSKYDFDDEDDEDEDMPIDDSVNGRPSYAELARWDPDQPIPTRENSREATTVTTIHTTTVTTEVAALENNEPGVLIKQEETEALTIDISTIPAADEEPAAAPPSASHVGDRERHSSVLRHGIDDQSDDGGSSRYSPTESETANAQQKLLQATIHQHSHGKETLDDAMALLTVKDYSEPTKKVPSAESSKGGFVGLPQYLDSSDWAIGMQEYCTPSPSLQHLEKPILEQTPHQTLAASESAPTMGESTDVATSGDGSEGTPESVIRRASDSISELGIEESQHLDAAEFGAENAYDGTHRSVSPVIPERKATIKTNGKLKARPSGTPADFAAMGVFDAEEHPVPAIPAEYNRDAAVAGAEQEDSQRSGVPTQGSASQSKLDLSLDIPDLSPPGAAEEGDLLGLDREFDRVIENQKKGYLMRQNTKVVVASNRNFSSDSNETTKSQRLSTDGSRPSSRNGPKASPRKPSGEQYLRTEPWNGKVRRKSLRNASAQRARDGPVPPLPGQESALGIVNEDQSLCDDSAADNERGRLFIKVVGVNDLDIPLPRNDRVDFKLTLDNGMYCVTTDALQLGHNAAIGQEFELVVQNDLEFQLTLSTRLPPPTKPKENLTARTPTASPTKAKASAFSRFLSSPKKRAEKERQEREAQETAERKQREDAARKRASVQPNAWDMLRELVNGADGSFARAYVNLAAHEEKCFGRKATVNVPLYNEWALEQDSAVVSSVRSKRGANCGPIRRPPYIIGNLECQLLYVPKPKGATDEEMPKSMSSAVREIGKATEIVDVSHEGFMSQQGGDCVHWRRRFFRVQGSKLTAYHEHTHQKRAVINLTKASRLVDDRSTLIADPVAGKSQSRSGRRKSAFGEEDEGYQYVEEGFRIRFANGETIDFYADSRADKDGWMEVLAQVIGKPDAGARKQRWTDLVLARERAESRPTSGQPILDTPSATEVRDFTKSPLPPAKDATDRKPFAKSAPNSPLKSAAARSHLPLAPPPARRPSTPPLQPRTGHRSRDAVKSMIF